MIFVGDIALPHKGAISLGEIPEELLSKAWLGNLEGSLVREGTTSRQGLYNSKEAIEEVLTKIPFAAFTLANNHILDLGIADLRQTIEYLKTNELPYCGAGEDLEGASAPLILKEGSQELVFLNFGWSVIQCPSAGVKKPGVNPLTRSQVAKSVEGALKKYPEANIIPIMHWNYELEAEPQPFERQLAKQLIDMGVAGVIGAHAHRVGGVEIYKNRPIVYSLGNWLFKQGVYKEGKTRFPAFCNLELAFEWDFASGDMKFHFFQFSPEESHLSYSHTASIGSEELEELTPFIGLSDSEYKSWYKQNHYHRNKGLPVYYWGDSNITIGIKNKLNLLRDQLVNVVQKIKS